jgi:hypothetical protein
MLCHHLTASHTIGHRRQRLAQSPWQQAGKIIIADGQDTAQPKRLKTTGYRKHRQLATSSARTPRTDNSNDQHEDRTATCQPSRHSTTHSNYHATLTDHARHED